MRTAVALDDIGWEALPYSLVVRDRVEDYPS